MYANYHVTDYLDPNNLTGFIKTIACDDDYVPSRKDVFALDCEMCYTTVGLELTRVTVVDINRKIVYDALVKPDNKIIDYNTMYVLNIAEMKRMRTELHCACHLIFHSPFGQIKIDCFDLYSLKCIKTKK